MHLHDVPAAVTPVTHRDNKSQPSDRMRAPRRSRTSEHEHARRRKDGRGSLGQDQRIGGTTLISSKLWLAVSSCGRTPVRKSRLCTSSRMPRQCEEVALPEQAINRGLAGYHRGRRPPSISAPCRGRTRDSGRMQPPVGSSAAIAPIRTYLSHRAKSLPTPCLDGQKRRKHGDLRHLGPLGLRRLTAELARSALTPRQVSRAPANPHLLGERAAGVSAEFERPSADFGDQMLSRQIVDPDRR